MVYVSVILLDLLKFIPISIGVTFTGNEPNEDERSLTLITRMSQSFIIFAGFCLLSLYLDRLKYQRAR